MTSMDRLYGDHVTVYHFTGRNTTVPSNEREVHNSAVHRQLKSRNEPGSVETPIAADMTLPVLPSEVTCVRIGVASPNPIGSATTKNDPSLLVSRH